MVSGGSGGKVRVIATPFLNRAQQCLLMFFTIITLWIVGLWNLNLIPTRLQFFIKVFPLWMAVTLGAIALGNIGYHLLTFRDCPEAFNELQRQIKLAKTDLSSKGFKFN